MGCAGGIAGGFALSFFVFDETGSTLASALVMSIQLLPHIFVPFLAAPIMDRLPRLAFLVGGDAANGIIYAAMGLWLMFFKFSYTGYLAVSLVLACLGSVDQLAYISIYPELLPKGAEQKGFAVSTMLYPVLSVIMMPLAAVLLDTLGVARLLIAQGGLSLAAAITESFIKLDEGEKKMREPYSFKAWADDIKEGLNYFKRERGLRSVYAYMAVSNGVASGLYPILVAFFRSFPGMTAAMYSFFSAVEFIGRTIGSAVQYRIKVPKKKKFGFILFVYQTYAVMDMILLWIPYPLMLLNRGICGFLGNNSAIMREAARADLYPLKPQSQSKRSEQCAHHLRCERIFSADWSARRGLGLSHLHDNRRRSYPGGLDHTDLERKEGRKKNLRARRRAGGCSPRSLKIFITIRYSKSAGRGSFLGRLGFYLRKGRHVQKSEKLPFCRAIFLI